MNENKLGFRITCEPDIKLNEDGTMTTIVDKIVCGRVKNANELIVEQVREIMKENGISEFYGIDESKVLQLIQEHKAFEIMKKYIHIGRPFGKACYIYLNDESEMIPEEEYDILEEAL